MLPGYDFCKKSRSGLFVPNPNGLINAVSIWNMAAELKDDGCNILEMEKALN